MPSVTPGDWNMKEISANSNEPISSTKMKASTRMKKRAPTPAVIVSTMSTTVAYRKPHQYPIGRMLSWRAQPGA